VTRYRVLAALLAALMVPGAAELAADALHLFATGHTEHDHETPVDAEHGCSGPFHACGCHSTAPFVDASDFAVGGAPALSVRFDAPTCDAPPAAHAPGPYRPPTA
jgi:hypothetical protein